MRNEVANMYDKSVKILKVNFDCFKGTYVRKDLTYIPTKKEYKAIDYLFSEWDYEYLTDKTLYDIAGHELLFR